MIDRASDMFSLKKYTKISLGPRSLPYYQWTMNIWQYHKLLLRVFQYFVSVQEFFIPSYCTKLLFVVFIYVKIIILFAWIIFRQDMQWPKFIGFTGYHYLLLSSGHYDILLYYRSCSRKYTPVFKGTPCIVGKS